MNTHLSNIDKYITSHLEENTSLLQRFVREPSVQGNEAGVQRLVSKHLESLGMEVETWELIHEDLSSHPNFIASRPSYKGSPNLAAVLKGVGGGKSILLNGHIDVVPEGDRAYWKDDPYSGTLRDGKVFGRGSTDMKGGNVAMMMALEAIVRSGIRLKGDVVFHSVIEEETGGMGTLAAVLRGFTADAALVPEPTNMKLFIRQQGSMWFRVSVPGVGAHGGTRYEGVSAIEKAIPIHAAILNLERERNKDVRDPLYSGIPIPFPINIGRFSSGNWPSSVADLATMEGRIGVAPGESMETVQAQLEQAVAAACAADPWLAKNPAKVEYFGGRWLPNGIEITHPFSQSVQKQFRDVFGKDVIIEASPWGTDAGILGQVGSIPALVIGPGETRMAHFPDEYISVQAMCDCARLFARVILDWCGTVS